MKIKRNTYLRAEQEGMQPVYTVFITNPVNRVCDEMPRIQKIGCGPEKYI